MQQSYNNPGFNPKHITYHQNNQGRDTYIYNDNGGFNRLQMPVLFKSGNGKMSNQKINQSQERKVIDIPLVNYFSDGTGRDQYIKYNHGGLCKNPRYTPNVFISTLRNSEKIQHVREDDYFLHSQFMRSKQDSIKNQTNLMVQTQLIQRLFSKEKIDTKKALPKLK